MTGTISTSCRGAQPVDERLERVLGVVHRRARRRRSPAGRRASSVLAQRRHRDLAVGRAPRAVGVEDEDVVRVERAGTCGRPRRATTVFAVHQRQDAAVDAPGVEVVVVRADRPGHARRRRLAEPLGRRRRRGAAPKTFCICAAVAAKPTASSWPRTSPADGIAIAARTSSSVGGAAERRRASGRRVTRTRTQRRLHLHGLSRHRAPTALRAAPLRQQPVDLLAEEGKGCGLGEVGVRTRGEDPLPVPSHGERGEGEYWRDGPARGPEPGEDLETVHAGELDVEDDEVVRRRGRQRRAPRARSRLRRRRSRASGRTPRGSSGSRRRPRRGGFGPWSR